MSFAEQSVANERLEGIESATDELLSFVEFPLTDLVEISTRGFHERAQRAQKALARLPGQDAVLAWERAQQAIEERDDADQATAGETFFNQLLEEE